MKKNIIITGGELFNKGAQAMTFVAVNECKKRFPDHEIFVLSEMDFRRPEEERAQYAFDFTGWFPVRFAYCQTNPLLRTACLLRNGKGLKECESIYRNCDLMIDVSGYGLGSNWSAPQIKQYIERLEYSRSFGIPFYLMPQSFGPFDFNDEQKRIVKDLPDLLRSVKVICAREREGYEELINGYHLENVRLLPDLVLNNRGIELSNIYRTIPQTELPTIAKNSVALVPNERIAEALGKKTALELYRSIVDFLLKRKKTVYVLSHASADYEMCMDIKESFSQDNRLVFLARDYSCIEFNEIVKEFRFVVASRFHAIAHAYKNCVPCVAVGWADKYCSLLESFEQECYAYDIRKGIELASLETKIELMDKQAEEEANRIQACLINVQAKNVFDLIDV